MKSKVISYRNSIKQTVSTQPDSYQHTNQPTTKLTSISTSSRTSKQSKQPESPAMITKTSYP